MRHRTTVQSIQKIKMENEMIDLKSIGVSGSSKMQILNRLYRCYEIQRKDIVLIDN